ncbi:MAG: SOS response-associated peptidase [Alphaproteobacteria bacterium]|nr:SOS response-associated peptidase [Alphaproteobacteria bacterium]
MCGRYSLTTPPEAVRRLFALTTTPNFPARYNIAPTQSVPVVRPSDASGGGRELAMLRWGLVPSWASELSIGAKMINARAETVSEKPAFRAAFRHRRCLVPADGFYEWQVEGKNKQPMRITLSDGGLFAFAGLWERWTKGLEGRLETFTIITTDASSSIAHIHERMPVMLEREDHEKWLDPRAGADDLKGLLRPFPPERLKAVAVSTRVNNVRHDDPACLEPFAMQGALL